MQAALSTVDCLMGTGFKEITSSRGESVYLLQNRSMILAFVVEGLGTLNKVAEDYFALTGISFMDSIHRANLATILNDLAVCGARPLVVNGFMAVGDEEYFSDPSIQADSVEGWVGGCLDAQCVAGGGETQKLRDIVVPKSAVLAGAALGIIKPKRRRIRGNVCAGDVLIMADSSGVHANGVTMVRDIAAALPDGYLTQMPSGFDFGTALLAPKHVLYGPLIQAALDEEIQIHYVSNITGHGWMKVMRLNKAFTYIIEEVPEIPELFRFIQEKSGASDKKMFQTFNMKCGCMFAVAQHHAQLFLDLMKRKGYGGSVVGYVEEGPRQVKIPSLDITFENEDYNVR